MRWQELFADLEQQAWSLDREDLDAEVADRTRAEVARLTLMGRLRAAMEVEVRLLLVGGHSVGGRIERLGADWLLVASPAERLVPLAAICSIEGLPSGAVSPDAVPAVAERLPLVVALRALAVDRAAVRFELVDGRAVAGTPDRVGADFVDVAVHDVGEAPRRASVRSRTTIRTAAIAVVSRETSGWA